jgi:hypothetical protein
MTDINVLIISCFFGKSNVNINEAPNKNCVFFSNNEKLRPIAENKRWKFIKVNLPLEDDYIECSLQSKYVKFLKFLNDFPQFKEFSKILYYDQKIHLKHEDVVKLLGEVDKNKSYNIVIRNHDQNWGVYEEARFASQQERYKKHMKETLEFVDSRLNKDGFTKESKVQLTGVILYNNYNDILPLTNEVYNTCMSLKQPECQIIWTVLSQKYIDKIKIIDHYYVNPERKDNEDINDAFTGSINKSASPFFGYVNIEGIFSIFFIFVLISLCVIMAFYVKKTNPVSFMKKLRK